MPDEPRRLAEAEIDYREAHIPEVAELATRLAYWQTLMSGYPVVVAEGDQLVEVSPDGSRRFLNRSRPPSALCRAR